MLSTQFYFFFSYDYKMQQLITISMRKYMKLYCRLDNLTAKPLFFSSIHFLYIHIITIQITIPTKLHTTMLLQRYPGEQTNMATLGLFKHKIKNYGRYQLRCHKISLEMNELVFNSFTRNGHTPINSTVANNQHPGHPLL